VLRRIFGAKIEKVAGDWKRLRNEELHNLHVSTNIRAIKSRRLRWAKSVARTVEMRNVHKMFIGKPEGKRTFGRPKRRGEGNIRMDLREGSRVGGCGLNPSGPR
jgi:hypothetical protein